MKQPGGFIFILYPNTYHYSRAKKQHTSLLIEILVLITMMFEVLTLCLSVVSR